MVVPYSGTQFTCREYVHEHVREARDAGRELPFAQEQEFAATIYITKLIWETIHEVVQSARLAMAWLQRAARVTAKEGKTLRWVTPTGFPVEQGYPKFTGQRVEMKIGDALEYHKPTLLLAKEGTVDTSDQVNGISPNFVHSLDAAALQLSIKWALENGLSEFAMVHDSYGCPAADAATFGACLREAFVEMYQSHDVLAEFKASTEAHTGVQLEPPPPMGTLDLDRVKDSDFFFA
jgi:DNA-directed RNA polymerase